MSQPGSAAAQPLADRWTVVVVDDVTDLRFVVRLALQRSGRFDVVAEADNGHKGIEMAAAHQPDLVLLDLYMPTMDGLEALPRIRAAAPGAKVVVFSGMADVFAESAVAQGAAGVIVKGAPSSELIGQLERILAAD